ncbi:hypothetical protein H6P81_007061 [Aristolochia fimbriata]|uniref:Uncharacterized protein n=1 Tax=Aristolochia fimbriata TaxID=158543 RepID=A0AAV7F2Y1_ARIFI|nr:hypothetical protein H6P81_007061 [Aristolochia fimbriata]
MNLPITKWWIGVSRIRNSGDSIRRISNWVMDSPITRINWVIAYHQSREGDRPITKCGWMIGGIAIRGWNPWSVVALSRIRNWVIAYHRIPSTGDSLSRIRRAVIALSRESVVGDSPITESAYRESMSVSVHQMGLSPTRIPAIGPITQLPRPAMRLITESRIGPISADRAYHRLLYSARGLSPDSSDSAIGLSPTHGSRMDRAITQFAILRDITQLTILWIGAINNSTTDSVIGLSPTTTL